MSTGDREPVCMAWASAHLHPFLLRNSHSCRNLRLSRLRRAFRVSGVYSTSVTTFGLLCLGTSFRGAGVSDQS